jgi:hypothetical protein
MSYSSWSAEELVRACVEAGNSEAWNEFVCRFRKLIACVVLRIARKYGESSPAIVDDLVQDVYLKVCSDNCRLLREFEPQHPDAFFGMLSGRIGLPCRNLSKLILFGERALHHHENSLSRRTQS